MSEILSLQSIDSSEHNVHPLNHGQAHEQTPDHKSALIGGAQADRESNTPKQLQQLTDVAKPSRTISRVSLAQLASKIKSNQSNTSKKSNIVPKLQRRGLLSFLALVPEYEDARDYPRSTKLFIVFIIAFAAITGPMGTSIMLPAIDDVAQDLGTTTSIVNVSVGIYLISLGIFPLWWSAFSESFGRRSVYVVSFVLFFAFSIGSSLSPNIGALIAFRVLCGGCSASVQAVGAGTIGDLYIQEERGTAMGLYYLGPLMGPFLSPILGGVVAQVWGWRATQWLMVIFSGCNVILISFGLPETLRKQDSVSAIRDILRRQLSDNNKDFEKGDMVDDEEEKDEEHMSPNEHDHEHEHNDKKNSNFIPPNITNTNNVHDLTEEDLERIATTLSRTVSRRSQHSSTFQVQNYHGKDDEELVLDSLMPSLSRLTTNKSNYSKRLTHQHVDAELEAAILEMASKIDLNEEIQHEDDEKDMIPLKTKLYNYVIRPLHSLILLRHPPVGLVIIFSSISFSCIYFFNLTISNEYGKDPYNFKSIIIGLLYIPNSVTYVLASIIGGKWNDRLLKKYAASHNGELVPESRLSWNVVLAISLYPPAMLIFGWCLQYSEHWVTPLIGTAFYGFASMLVIGATVTYLIDSLPGKGATGVALNNLVRMILAAIATFVTEPALKGIGPGKLFSILMAVAMTSSLSVLYAKRNGDYFRKNYDLGKLYDRL